MSTLKITTLTDENTCNFCKNALAKYTCPKCNMLYCTLKCYQSEQHLACSEQFYKDLVQEQIQSQSDKATTSTEQKMQEILKRFHQQNQINENENLASKEEFELDSDDDENVADLGNRLSGIDLDNSEAVWQNLTEAERKDFEAFLLSGDVANFMPVWTPWWEFRSSAGVLDPQVFNDHKEKCPDIGGKISKFSEISKKPPAKCVENNMINVLAAYAFLQRYFNGETKEFPSEFSMFLWKLSNNLNQNDNFDSAALAIDHVTMQCCACEELGMTTDQENLQHIKKDVNCLLGGPHVSERKFYLLCAFFEMRNLLTKAKKKIGNDAQNTADQGEFYTKFTAQQTKALESFSKTDIKAALRKVEYYLSFINDVYQKF